LETAGVETAGVSTFFGKPPVSVHFLAATRWRVGSPAIMGRPLRLVADGLVSDALDRGNIRGP
jgi:hypothetical protein